MGCSPVCLPWLTIHPTFDCRTSSVWSGRARETVSFTHDTQLSHDDVWIRKDYVSHSQTQTKWMIEWNSWISLSLSRIIPQSVTWLREPCDKRIHRFAPLPADTTWRDESDSYILYLPLHSFKYVIVLSSSLSHKLYNEIVANLLY